MPRRVRTGAVPAADLALLGAGAFAGTVLLLAAHATLPDRAWRVHLLLCLVALLAFGSRAFAARMRAPAALLVSGVLLGVGAVLALVPPGGVPPAAVVALVWLVAARERAIAAVLLLLLTVLAPFIAGATRPDLLRALPLSILLACVAGALLHGRESRRRLARRGEEPPRERSPAVWSRAAAGAGLSLTILLVGMLLFSAHARLTRSFHEWRASAGAAPEQPAAEPDPGRASGSDEERDSLILSPGLWSRGGDSVDRRLMRLRLYRRDVRAHEGHGRPFLLRGDVLDVVDRQGFLSPGTRRPEPLHAVDGWFVGPDPAADGDLEVRIEAQPRARGRRTPLFGVEPLQAVRIADSPAAVALFATRPGVIELQGGPDPVSYSVRTDSRRFALALLDGEVDRSFLRAHTARHSDPMYTALPDGPAERVALAALAAGAADARTTDLDRILAVVGSLRSSYRYAAGSEFNGTWAGLGEMLWRREGVCAHFAAAGLVMLRSLGLPARAATGFLVQDYDDDSRAYGVWESNRHAWVEVHFEGFGWVPFDVTPDAALHRMLASRLAASGAEGGDSGDGAESGEETPAADPAGLDALLDQVLALPGRLWSGAWARFGTLGGGLLAALLLFAGALLLRRRRRPAGADALHVRGLPAAERSRFERLLRALADLGHHRLPQQTPREFAAAIHDRDAQLAALPDAIELFYRSRYGRRPLDGAEMARIDALIAALHARRVRGPVAAG